MANPRPRALRERDLTVKLDMPEGGCFVTSESSGLFEICVDLGAEVRERQVVARVHEVERTGRRPVEEDAGISGLLAGCNFAGLIAPGDFLAAAAVPAA